MRRKEQVAIESLRRVPMRIEFYRRAVTPVGLLGAGGANRWRHTRSRRALEISAQAHSAASLLAEARGAISAKRPPTSRRRIAIGDFTRF
jgi:hypothetical protein